MGISRGPEDYITASLARSRILTSYTRTPSNTARTSSALLPTPTRTGLFSITSPLRVSDELDRTSIYIAKSRKDLKCGRCTRKEQEDGKVEKDIKIGRSKRRK
jgi:hypothetical protein